MKHLLLAICVTAAHAEPLSISGIYPSLAMFNEEHECGTGAVVPWADRLWVVTYAPHKPSGSSDKLYEITPDLRQIIRPESIGGTPANRMIHPESRQLFIGPHAIGADGTVRTIPYSKMFGRPTGMARHLSDPENRILMATMEEGVYEINVHTLEVTELWADEQQKKGRHADLPGYHGKGFYSSQGRYVYANNGDHAREARTDPTVESGVLAEWDGKAEQWTVVRRNQFTEVTGPGGIQGGKVEDPLWSIGWDHRSLILMLLDKGKWQSFRLPKASHSYDGAHGWNTEWPRIRDIGERDLLMTMHGSFWRFPRTFSAADTSGIRPRSNYLKVVGDFCRWGDRIVLGCDDTAKSEFLNKHDLVGKVAGPGQSQSNLWFLQPTQLDEFGPALGRGAVWMKDNIEADTTSDAYLFSGFDKRGLHLSHRSEREVVFEIETDDKGDGTWAAKGTISVPAGSSIWKEFEAKDIGVWIRLRATSAAAQVTAFFHYRNADQRTTELPPLAKGIATTTQPASNKGVVHARGGGFKTLRYVTESGIAYDLDGDLTLKKSDDAKGAAWTATNVAIPEPIITSDTASVVYQDAAGVKWRLPKGDEGVNPPLAGRVCREVCTERNLLNVGGTLYEMPAENAGGFLMIRPITTHQLAIYDYASYRGLLVMSGITDGIENDHIIRSDDGAAALWVGGVDDLWKLGKPRGRGGPWHATAVKKDQPSDPYLATGYDHKYLTLSHDSPTPVSFHIEADFTGRGDWSRFATLEVPSGKPLEFTFPDSFGAYWLRLVPAAATTATAEFLYE